MRTHELISDNERRLYINDDYGKYLNSMVKEVEAPEERLRAKLSTHFNHRSGY